MYNIFVKGHSSIMDQHTAMLPLTIGAIDHSHKVHLFLGASNITDC